MSKAVQGTKASSFHAPTLGGEVINHIPPPPPVEYFPDWPIIQFPPCFPFCGANQGGLLQLQRDRAAEDAAEDAERAQRRAERDAERELENQD
jgi:hypothetical protein